MINTQKAIGTSIQVSEDVLTDFFMPINKRKGKIKNKSHVIPIYFYRYIGSEKNEELYHKELKELDDKLLNLGGLYRRFISPLPNIVDNQILGKIYSVFEAYNDKNFSSDSLEEILNLLIKNNILPKLNNKIIDYSIEKSFKQVIETYFNNEKVISLTLIKNFIIKLGTWINKFVPSLLKEFNLSNVWTKEINNPKVLYYGDIKKHEIYFLIFLSKLGCDVLYINSLEDKYFPQIDMYNQYSKVIKHSKCFRLKEFPKNNIERSINNIEIPVNNIKKLEPKMSRGKIEPVKIQPSININCNESQLNKAEKSFEELARLSTSTVMIKKYDKEDKVIGTGSGVVINNKGLIITNFHVVKNGTYFGIIFEDVKEEFYTYTVVNWDVERDLALIKISLSTTAIQMDVYGEVRRGQKVVAIGSPLGLMNTISDGIVSGFRRSEVEDFIQITAPISPGSSGGALFNMYGELIGITSAGYVEGQNINLAIPIKYVYRLLQEEFTKINEEIIDRCSYFKFHNFILHFDGFFRYTKDNLYKISLYRFEYSEYDFYTLTKQYGFKSSVENFYIEIISHIAKEYNLNKIEFEIGSENYIFSYTYDNNIIKNKYWK